MSRKKPIPDASKSKPKRPKQARRASAKARTNPQAKVLLDVAAEKRYEADRKRQTEDAVLGKINWQWRKFALGLMNGLNNYKAYAEAYDMNDVDRDERAYQLASVYASRLLKNDKFREYWRELIVEQGFNHDVVDTEMVKLITDPDTPGAVRRATIHDYNELTGRIIKKQTITDGEGKSLFDVDSFKIEVVRNNGRIDSES